MTRERSLHICTCIDSVFSDLVSVLMVIVWLGGDPVSPLRPICDLRILDHFVREARDSEVIMVRSLRHAALFSIIFIFQTYSLFLLFSAGLQRRLRCDKILLCSFD